MKPMFFSLLLLIPAAPLVAQQAAAPLSTKCTIEGLVVKAATGEPLKKAHLALRKAQEREEPYVASTGVDGRFVFKDIEPGRYTLWVNRNGYVSQEHGQRAPNRPGTILTLEPGQNLRDVVFRLIPAAVITGRVYDEDGEPTENVSVQALRYRYIRGQRQLVPAGGVVTNDLGEYRLYGLPPGQYYVRANYTPGRAIMGSGGGVVVGRSGEAPAEEGYLPTFYPSTNDPSRATPLTVQGGEVVSGIDFTLLPTRAVRLRGRVFNAVTGRPGRGTTIMLMPRESSVRSFAFRNQVYVEDAQGNFELRGVTRGSYTLFAMWFDEGKQYSTRVPIDVGTTDLSGVTVVITPGVELAGLVRLEGQSQPLGATQENQSTAKGKSEGELDLTELRIYLAPREDVPLGGESAAVKAGGAFALRNVAPGDYRVGISGMPQDSYLKAARFAGEDVREAGLSLGAGQPSGSLELLVSSAGGRIDGSVLKEQQAFSGAQVVLIPEPPRRGIPQFYRTTPTDQNGQFTLRGIPPGEYKLFAWEEVEVGAYQDSEFLRSYEDRGKPVRLEERSRLSVQLELISSDKLPR